MFWGLFFAIFSFVLSILKINKKVRNNIIVLYLLETQKNMKWNILWKVSKTFSKVPPAQRDIPENMEKEKNDLFMDLRFIFNSKKIISFVSAPIHVMGITLFLVCCIKISMLIYKLYSDLYICDDFIKLVKMVVAPDKLDSWNNMPEIIPCDFITNTYFVDLAILILSISN